MCSSSPDVETIYETIMYPDELEGFIDGISGAYGTPPRTDWIDAGELARLKVALARWKKSKNKPELVK